MDAVALAVRLQSTREYARSCAELPVEEVIAGCLESLETFGFCVIDHVIPEPELTAVVDEIVTVTPAIQDERRDYLQRSAEVRKRQAELHERGEVVTPEAVGYEPRRCEIHHLPVFAPYLAHPAVIGVARGALDPHVRIAQFGPRHVAPQTEGERPDWSQRVGEAQPVAAGREMREWHTDWPHQPTAYGAGFANSGGFEQRPTGFADVCAGLTMVWYLTDTDSESGGTWVVP